MSQPRATIQLCTYNRAQLLGRVLDACFEQTIASDAYEVVLVNDGARDETPRVIEEAKLRATCTFTVVDQPNAGLARARNAGIARARGERIIFIDDDVLPIPAFVAEHLRSGARHPGAIVRGAVINTESFERLPTPTWTIANYSGNFFWTSNVSLPLATLRAVGNFTESFREYGWEDIELGLRLRFAGVRGVFNRYAVAFHHKPRPGAAQVAGMLRQAQASGADGGTFARIASALARRARYGRRSGTPHVASRVAGGRRDASFGAHRARTGRARGPDESRTGSGAVARARGVL